MCKEVIKEFGLPSVEDLDAFMKEAFSCQHREVHYFAVDVMDKMIKKIPVEFFETLKYMLLHQSWWDTVDSIAVRHVGTLLKRFPELLPVMDDWIEDENMWLRRTAILYQLKYKDDTDINRLFDYCKRRAFETEFFIRKAIGWALREYSKSNKESIVDFVEKTPGLSGLSRREALKWLERRKEKDF